MPSRPKRTCSYPGCTELTDTGRCDKHTGRKWNEYDDSKRGTAAQRGYDTRWRKARASYLRHHPLCVECAKYGEIKAATVIDHIIPHRGEQSLFWDMGNWQPLCKRCHDQKTARGE